VKCWKSLRKKPSIWLIQILAWLLPLVKRETDTETDGVFAAKIVEKPVD